MEAQFPWPSTAGEKPVWSGRGFLIGGMKTPVLSFGVDDSGWTEDLTRFHEENAGSDHFIDRASRAHALYRVKRFLAGRSSVVLEVGCSSGFFLEELHAALSNCFLIGADYVRAPLDLLAQRQPCVPLLQFDLTRCPLPDACVDMVVMLNVLEHIKDDVGALKEVRRILRPGGGVFVEVPAGPNLYDVYDKVLMHHRRYTLAGLRALLTGSGFQVDYASSIGTLLYPGFWYIKRQNKRYLSSSEDVQREIVAASIKKSGRSRLLESIMWIESAFRRVIPLPFGIRCVATGIRA